MKTGNTVVDAVTDKQYAVDVKQLISALKQRNKVLIVVEGGDDKKVYSQFFKSDRCEIYSLNGCDYFNEVLSLNSSREDYFFVIKDADFDHVINPEYDYPNLFRTDVHDVEMMMITDKFKSNFSFEYLAGDEKSPIFQDVIDELVPLSYLKYYMMEHKLPVSFKITLKQFYDGRTTCNLTACLKSLEIKPENRSHLPAEIDVRKFIDTHKAELYQITNGHDFCSGLVYKYHANSGKNLSKDEVERCLRFSYDMTEFSKTRLYAAIKQWITKRSYDLFRSA
jgi:hypothetical protein